MAKAKKEKLSLEELLEQAIVKEEDRPYEVPENWVWTRLKHILKTMVSKKPNQQQETFRYIDIDAIDNKNQCIYSPKTIPVKEAPSRASREVCEGDTLFSLVRPYLRNIAYINKEYNDCIASTGFYICKPTLATNPKYLFYVICSEYIINTVNQYMKGDNSPSVRSTEFESCAIPIPPIVEQNRIVKVIESLFEKLDKAKELVQNVLDSFESRKAAVLHKAFTGELTANWREEHGVSLDSWEETLFGSLIKNGPQNGLYKPQTAYGHGCMIVRIDNFYDGVINPWNTLKRLSLDEQEKEIYALQNNDIIINRVNSIQYLGKSALVKRLNDICVFESNVMRLSLVEDAVPEYIIKYLNSSQGLGELRKNAKHAVNQASINQTDVKNAIIKLPRIEEQKEIVRILDNLLEKEQKAKELSDTIEKIDLMKKAILAKAFRGKLGTNDPEEESAVNLLKELLKEKI